METTDDAPIDPSGLIEHVRRRLARHKAPRHVMPVSTIGRGPNGKADYPAVRRRIVDWLAKDPEHRGTST